jgi:hypothetical protein
MTDQCQLTVMGQNIAPGIIRGAACWRAFMARLDAAGANDRLPQPGANDRIREFDTVSARRELMLNAYRIPRGSCGVVTLERDNGRLLDVRFFRNPRICVTLRADDLKIAH